MLIGKPEPVAFDFDLNGRWQESLDLLDSEIMFASVRENYPITDPDGQLLIGLLRRQYIRVHAQKYSLSKKFTPEEDQAARHFAMSLNKRGSGAIQHALRIYGKHEPLARRNEYNALFYPAIKLYVRFGALYPAKLLAMLGEGQCNGVALFRDCADSYTEDRFFLFTLGIAKADFLALMEQEQAKRTEELAQALQEFQEQNKGIIPKPIGYDEGDGGHG